MCIVDLFMHIVNIVDLFMYVVNGTNLTKMEFASVQDDQLVFANEENGATIYRGIY